MMQFRWQSHSLSAKSLKLSIELDTYNDLRVDAFNINAQNFDFEKQPWTSVNVHKHMQRAYYQL